MEELRTSDLTEVAVLTGRPWWDEGPGEWFPAISGIRNPALTRGRNGSVRRPGIRFSS